MCNLRYVLNDWRQKLVFHKDFYTHYLKYGLRQDICVSVPEEQLTIPKILHYCWFGGAEYPDKIRQCMESWYKVLPEYDFKLWNERNFPFEEYPFAEQALRDRKWAFVSDVARLHALYKYGGVYVDTDVEMLKPIDEFLKYDFFSSFESSRHIPTALMAAKKGSSYVDYLLKWYKNRTYSAKDYYEIANTKIITKITQLAISIPMNNREYHFGNNVYFPREYFCPERVDEKFNVTEHTYCIHHVTGSWG